MTRPEVDPLLVGLAAGSDKAFAVLYDRYAGRLYRAAMATLGCREDAEDVVHDVFMALVRSRAKLTEVNDLNAYLFTALRRAAAGRLARRARQPVASEAAEEAVAGPSGPESAETHDPRLARALRALPPEQREVIALKIDAELTFAQIGEVLNISMNTAASRYRYALGKLRDSLARSTKE